VPLLDSISLTGYMTDPTEPEVPPASRTGTDVLGELPKWQAEQADALPTGGSRQGRPELGPATGEIGAAAVLAAGDLGAGAVPAATAHGAEPSAAASLQSWWWAAATQGVHGADPSGEDPTGDVGEQVADPPDAIDLLAVIEMPTGFAWGSALDLLDALDQAAGPSPPAGPGSVELLDAIVGPVGQAAAQLSDADASGQPAADSGPAYLPIPEPSSVVVPDEVIDGPPSSTSTPDVAPRPNRSLPAGSPGPTPGEGASGGKRTRRARRASIVTGIGTCLLVGGCLVAGGVIPAHSAPPSLSPSASTRMHELMGEPVVARLLGSSSPLDLPPATTAPVPAPPSVAAAATASHEVFGYAPYWSLPGESGFPVGDFSTIAYFSVDVNPDGTVQQSGPGWDGYRSQALVNLISRAHAAGDRVVLTATDFAQPSLDAITHDPGAGTVLGENLLALVQAKHLDGVNLDFEGNGSADQAGLDRLVSEVGNVLHAANPEYQLTMATYASSAGDPYGFYDIRGLARSVDAFFVMAYDVNQGPAAGPSTGSGPYSDGRYLDQYVSAVGASKVIFGVPLFGYDMATTGPALGDAVTGPAQPVTVAQALASGPTYWDAASDTAWTAYRAGSQWHQVFFDNANTLALKEQLAVGSGLLGIGAWALGMEGSDDSLLAVLDGSAPPSRVPPVGPSVPPGSAGAAPGAGGAPTTSAPGQPNPPGGGRVTGGAGGGHRHRSSSGGSGSTTTTTTRPRETTTTTTSPTTTTTTTAPTTTTTTTAPTTTTTTSTGAAASATSSGRRSGIP
jgi:hypothetical protein